MIGLLGDKNTKYHEFEMKKIPVIVILIVTVLALVGCSYPTAMEVRGVSRDKVIFALWKQGVYRQVCASSNDCDKPKTVIKYYDDSLLDFLIPNLNTIHMKDTVYIKEKGPNDICVSLKCESKTVPLNLFWGLFTPYERNIGREKSILIEAAEELYAFNPSMKWEGQWCRFIPRQRPAFGNSIWFAYEADSADLILEYFYNQGYKESYDKAIEEWTFTRHLTSEPNNWSKSKKKALGGKWESYEKVVVGQISAGFSRANIVVGIAAIGIQVNPSLAVVKKHDDIGEELRDKLLEDLTKLLEDNSKTTTFVSPYLWIKSISMPTYEKNRLILIFGE